MLRAGDVFESVTKRKGEGLEDTRVCLPVGEEFWSADNPLGSDILCRAVARRRWDLVLLLLQEARPALNLPNSYGLTALSIACDNGDEDMATLLIESGAHVDANEGEALESAIRSGHRKVVDILLKAGVNTTLKGSAALEIAATAGHSDIVLQLLLEVGVDL
jgi:ankyrin repeat protein